MRSNTSWRRLIGPWMFGGRTVTLRLQCARLQFQRGSHVGVFGTEHKRQIACRTLCQISCLGCIAASEPNPPKAEQRISDVLVMGAEAPFPHCERTSCDLLGFVEARETAKRLRQVPQREADVWVVGRQALLLCRERPT